MNAASEWIDARPFEVEAEPEESEVVDEPEERLGAWPEDMEIQYYADSSLTIPGQSEPPGDCGTWGPREFCKCCGDVVLGPRRCQRRICEECWLTWRGNQAASLTRRLAGARHHAEGAEKRLTHTVVSPPPGSIKTLTQYERAKKRAYEIAKEKGIRGGALIPHGWRVRDEAKRLYRESVEAGVVESDVGIWQWVREQKRDWRTLTYWSPHFHVLGVGAEVGESDPAGDDGWVFSRIASFSRFRISDPDSYEGMFRASSYLLSHVAFESDAGKQTVRWFGELANNQFSLEADLSEWERSVIERNVEKVSGYGEDGDGKRECGVEECEGGLAPIWSAASHLADPVWCEEIGDQEAILVAAFEWSIGEVVPPPGLRYPKTERDCKQAWGHLLGRADVSL